MTQDHNQCQLIYLDAIPFCFSLHPCHASAGNCKVLWHWRASADARASHLFQELYGPLIHTPCLIKFPPVLKDFSKTVDADVRVCMLRAQHLLSNL